jgi:hypothetical protein
VIKLYGNAAREAAIQNALLSRLSASYERRVRSEIRRAMIASAAAYEDSGDIGVMAVIGDHANRLESILSPLWTTVIRSFSERVQVGKMQRKDSFFDRLVRRWLNTHAYESLAQISTTTRDSIRDIIYRGVDEGFGVDKIGAAIRQAAPILSKYRAHVIARTEAHGAGNFGSLETAKDIGGVKKEWIPVTDERTRETDEFNHVDAAQIVDLDAPFIVSGEELQYPGDSAGSPGNIIMCRCVVGYVRL